MWHWLNRNPFYMFVWLLAHCGTAAFVDLDPKQLKQPVFYKWTAVTFLRGSRAWPSR